MLTLHRPSELLSRIKIGSWAKGFMALAIASAAGFLLQAMPASAYLRNPVNSVQQTLDAGTLLAVEHVKHNKNKDKFGKNKNNPLAQSHVALSGTVALGGTVVVGGKEVSVNDKVAVDSKSTSTPMPDNVAAETGSGAATATAETTGGGEAESTGTGTGDSSTQDATSDATVDTGSEGDGSAAGTASGVGTSSGVN